MKDGSGHLARGAVLAAAAGLLLVIGWDLYARHLLFNSGDAALLERFRSHRAEFEELLGLEHAHLRVVGYAPTLQDSVRSLSRAAEADRRWRVLTRALGLDGDNLLVADSLIYFSVSAWLPRVRFQDVKGYAFSTRPLENLVEDLDAVVVRPRRRGEVLRWHRALEGSWYLYREIGGWRSR